MCEKSYWVFCESNLWIPSVFPEKPSMLGLEGPFACDIQKGDSIQFCDVVVCQPEEFQLQRLNSPILPSQKGCKEQPQLWNDDDDKNY